MIRPSSVISLTASTTVTRLEIAVDRIDRLRRIDGKRVDARARASDLCKPGIGGFEVTRKRRSGS